MPTTTTTACNWGQLEWAQPVIDIVLQGSNATVDYQLQQLLQVDGAQQSYFRFQVELTADSVAMDDASDAQPEVLDGPDPRLSRPPRRARETRPGVRADHGLIDSTAWRPTAGVATVKGALLLRVNVPQLDVQQANLQSIDIGQVAIGPITVGDLVINNVDVSMSAAQGVLQNVSVTITIHVSVEWEVHVGHAGLDSRHQRRRHLRSRLASASDRSASATSSSPG